MAVPEANLDEYDKEAQDVLEGTGAQPGEGPIPDLEDVNPTPPTTVEAEGPTEFGGLPPTAPPPPPPTSAPVEGGTVSQAPQPVSAEDITKRQGEIDAQKADVQAATADRMAAAAQQADEDARLERADYLDRRQAAEKDLNDKIKAYEAANSAGRPNFKDRLNTPKGRLAVIFGGLGAAQRSAHGGDNNNVGLENLRREWEDDTALQKANIAALRDNTVMARTRLNDVEAGRREMLRDADARLVAKYNLALKQGEAQLRARGATQAEIDTDKRILQLRQGHAAAKLAARKDEDVHQLQQAKIRRLDAQAARDKAKAAGRGGGGTSRKAQLAERRMELAEGRDERQEAAPIIKEMDDSLKEFRAKGGVKESLEHSDRSLAAVEKNPDNPTNWVNLTDAMIRSNTGRSAIMSQYKLYTGHAAGSIDVAAQFFHKLADGGLSDAQKANLLASARGSNNELRAAAKDVYDNFRRYDEDPRVDANPTLKGHYVATERNVFGTLPGYQKPEKAAGSAPAKNAPTAGAFVPGQVRKLKNGQTVKITSADGDYEVVSNGRR